MDIKNELESVKAFLVDCFPSNVKISVENKPAELTPKFVAVELVGNRIATPESAFHNRIDSTVQITYYASNKLECLESMQAMLKKLSNKRAIPLNGTDRFIKFHAPSTTGALGTQTANVYIIACILRIYTRAAIPQQEYELINEINAEYDGDN